MLERKLRKYEHALVISGTGIIIFGAWSVLKAAIFFLLTPMDQLGKVFTQGHKEEMGLGNVSDTVIAYVVLGIVLIMLIVSLAIRYYIGRAAIQDGRRIRRRRPVYIALAFLIGVSLIMSSVNRVQGEQYEGAEWLKVTDPAEVSIIVDATSLLCVVEMIIAAIMVRRLRKQLGVVIGRKGQIDPAEEEPRKEVG